MIREVAREEATYWFYRLPLKQQIATLSPEYVAVDAMRDKRLKPCFLLYSEGEAFWMVGMHKDNVPNSDYYDFRAPYGYGGPISNVSDSDFLERAWCSYLQWCWSNHILAEFVRLHPLLDQPYFGDRRPNRTTFTCGPIPYPNCRGAIQKAERSGLVVTHADPSIISSNFKVDYRRDMEDKKTSEFYFFNDAYFEALSTMSGVHLLICEEDEEWRSAAVFLAGGSTMEYHLSITNQRGKKQGATNLLIQKAYASMPEGELFLGGGRTTAEDDSLAKFKASFGGKKLTFNLGSHIHRPDVYREMRGDNTNPNVLFWR